MIQKQRMEQARLASEREQHRITQLEQVETEQEDESWKTVVEILTRPEPEYVREYREKQAEEELRKLQLQMEIDKQEREETARKYREAGIRVVPQ